MIVGLTGGIGSGKTTVAKHWITKGIPVYNSDDRAKELMLTEPIKEQIIHAFGEESYQNNELNRVFLASKVFKNSKKLTELNNIVHPAVFNDFKEWKEEQTSPLIVKEAAILFESGSFKDCDIIVSVIATEEIRIKRVMKRNGLKRTQIKDRIKKQWSDDLRIKNSDFILSNNGTLEELIMDADELMENLLKKTK